jgi:hypothetical protein
VTDLTKVRLPRVGTGTVSWQDLEPYLEIILREILAPAAAEGEVATVATITAAIAAHAAAVNPHPTYLTQAEGDARYPLQSVTAVADATGGVTIDTECRAQLNALLAALRVTNVIDT